MAIHTLQPTSNQTPDPALVGSLAVLSPSNTGYGNTTVTSFASAGAGGFSASDSDSSSIRWSGFQNVSGQIKSITLKWNWTHNGDFNLNFDEIDTGFGAASAAHLFEYSLNNGTNWTAADGRSYSRSTPGSNLFDSTISSSISLPSTTPINQILFRASSHSTDVNVISGISTPADGSATITGSVSNIRLEVETYDQTNILVLM